MPEFMQGTVDAPVVGRVKKVYVLVPLGLAGAFVAWRWYQAAQEPAPDPTADGVYGNDDLSEYGLSTSGGSQPVTGNNGAIETDGRTSDVDTNAEWTNKAVELLANSGYDPMAVSAALGEFLDRRALDKAEASIARAAIGRAGQPPEGRPWSVLEEATTGSGKLAAPKGLKAGGTATPTAVPLTWDKVDGALGYRIYRATGENVGYSLDTKFTATGLQPDTAYPFSVAAVNTSGKTGDRSAVVTLRTAKVKLTRPVGLKASSITRTSFRVSCTAVKGATYYRWYVNGAASGASDQPYRDFTGRKPNTAYKITVAADTTNQEPGPTSAPLSVKTKK